MENKTGARPANEITNALLIVVIFTTICVQATTAILKAVILKAVILKALPLEQLLASLYQYL